MNDKNNNGSWLINDKHIFVTYRMIVFHVWNDSELCSYPTVTCGILLNHTEGSNFTILSLVFIMISPCKEQSFIFQRELTEKLYFVLGMI